MPKDNAQTVGSLVGHIGVRDAIHTPIISAMAGTALEPGCPVVVHTTGVAMASTHHECIGVVDPFLRKNVVAGESFWVWVRPGSISSLTHRWTHKAIPDLEESIPDKEHARVRLEEFAEQSLHVSLAEMLDVIESCRRNGDPLLDHGYEGLGLPDGFWSDYEAFTGKQDPNKEGYFYFFTCGGCS